ncbi:TTK family protein kinase [Reticulomyxa filosa]|uniref:TTK family protein kinase n=1 Tax=Reticulomyxa filosa TaxID=46433 RepID=X6PDU2_RETFI|nr:TTK family protein kinase [Reticulomyxa filosa]|eukprot:ETO35837.1 TTK family protein kinase [Reticulomyxa filosa]
MDILGHLVYPFSSNNCQCLRYLLTSDIRHEIGDDQIQSALDRAIVMQNEAAIQVLISTQYLDENKKIMRDYGIQISQEKSKMELLLHYLKTRHGNEFEVVMNTLCDVIVEMIKDRKLLSKDVYNLCYLFKPQFVWEALFCQCKQLLNIETLNSNPCDWEWIQEHVLNDRQMVVWLDTVDHRQANETKSEEKTTKEDEEDEEEEDEEEEEEEEEDDNDNDNDDYRNNNNNNNNNNNKIESMIKWKVSRLKWREVVDLCTEQTKKEVEGLRRRLEKEIIEHELVFEDICNFHCNEMIHSEYLGKDKKKNWRQDKCRYGLKSKIKDEKELDYRSICTGYDGDPSIHTHNSGNLSVPYASSSSSASSSLSSSFSSSSSSSSSFPNSLSSNSSYFTAANYSRNSYNSKYAWDFDIYLTELIQRAHDMDEGFQSEMRKFFRECGGTCKYSRAPIKSHHSCKQKVQSEYANERFPKSAHLMDLVRCTATFDTLDDYLLGLHKFKDFLRDSSDRFELMRVKNSFVNDEDSAKAYDKRTSAQKRYTIPEGYRDIKFNVIYTDLEWMQSIICEVEFLWKEMYDWKIKEQKFYEIIRQQSFRQGSYEQLLFNHFDFQLKLACFNSRHLCPLMLRYPLEFAKSDYVKVIKDDSESNFVTNIAYSAAMEYQCAQELLQVLIPQDIVQQQLLERNVEDNCALTYALWKQTSMKAIELFILLTPMNRFGVTLKKYFFY